MTSSAFVFALGLACAHLALPAFASPSASRPQCGVRPPLAAPDVPKRAVLASDIPVAHTPPGGYRDRFPPPVLAACTEPLAAGAPDLRGLWKTLRAEQADDPSASRLASVPRFWFWNTLGVTRARKPLPPGHAIYDYVERIEQCGNRIVDTGGGTIADARVDGTEASGVHDVSAFDFTTPIDVIASFENGVFVLRPPKLPIRITRWLDADGNLTWHRPDLGDRLVTLRRIGGPCDTPPGRAWAR
jgi:hypothetical protein